MIYTFDAWQCVILPYPTLSRQLETLPLINDIIKTKVPDIVLGCVQSCDPARVNLVEYLCFYDKNEVMYFDDDNTLIDLFRYSIPDLDDYSQKIINDRLEKRFK